MAKLYPVRFHDLKFFGAKMKTLIANIKFLMKVRLDDEFNDVYSDLCDVNNELTDAHTRIHGVSNNLVDHKRWAVEEIGSIAESIENTRLPLHSSKVCIPCPDILEHGDWVTPAYFCNTCGIANTVEVAQLAYNTWKATHFDKEPTRSRHNEAYPVYPVGFLRDLINDRYADIINK